MMVRDIEPDTSNKLRSVEYYEMVNVVYGNIVFVIEELKEIKDIIKKFPDDVQKDFLIDNFFDHIKKLELIYDEKNLNAFMTDFTEIDNYNSLLKEIKDSQEQIRDIESKSTIPYLSELCDRKMSEVKEKSSLNTKDNEKLEELRKTILETKSISEELDDAYHAKEELEEMVKSFDNLKTRFETKETYEESFVSEYEKLEVSRKKIQEMSDYLKQREINLAHWEELQKELNKVTDMYDDLCLIRSSTSNKDGIPLVYIKFYLKNIKELANALLDIVYEGKIYIQDFYITGNDFTIPFVKNGIEIPDISFASQGEQSFLSMAISFALSSENLKKYNIPLLDEVDSTFDSSNRERFLSIIEHQNDIIQCEQEFVISHNNMFSQYPVDVLDFSDLKHSKFDVVIE